MRKTLKRFFIYEYSMYDETNVHTLCVLTTYNISMRQIEIQFNSKKKTR